MRDAGATLNDPRNGPYGAPTGQLGGDPAVRKSKPLRPNVDRAELYAREAYDEYCRGTLTYTPPSWDKASEHTKAIWRRIGERLVGLDNEIRF